MSLLPCSSYHQNIPSSNFSKKHQSNNVKRKILSLCRSCDQKLPKEHFTKSQLKKKKRRCISCISKPKIESIESTSVKVKAKEKNKKKRNEAPHSPALNTTPSAPSSTSILDGPQEDKSSNNCEDDRFLVMEEEKSKNLLPPETLSTGP